MSATPMTPNDVIRNVGAALFGTHWQTDLAAALSVSDRTVRRWVANQDTPRPGVIADLRQIIKARQADLLRAATIIDHPEAT